MVEPLEEHLSWEEQEAAAEKVAADLRRQIEALKVKVWTYRSDDEAMDGAR